MTALPSVDTTVLHVGGCQLTEVAPQPWHAVQVATWALDCEVEGCRFSADGLDHGDALQIAYQHKYATHPKTERGCAICGAPVQPGRVWCSVSCHRADEPGAYGDDPAWPFPEPGYDTVGPFDVAYPEIGEDL